MFENFNQPIDIYCERLTPDFWAEPVNALSNLAFILAAFFAYRLYKKTNTQSRNIKALIWLTAIVGIGSFVFHTVATHGAMLADVIPIFIFILCAIYVIFTRVLNCKWWQGLAAIFAFLAFNALVINAFGRALFNGSIQYVPTFLLLLLVAIYCFWKKYSGGKEFLISAFAFLLALTFRSIDQQVCASFPIGTHFLWHVLNGVVMFYVVKGLIKTEHK